MTFFPKWQANTKCNIQLRVQSGNQTQILNYDMIGIGTEPLSEGHVHLQCELMQVKKHFLIVVWVAWRLEA